MSDSAMRSAEDLRKFLACFNRQDVEGILGFFAPEGVYETPRAGNKPGRRLEGPEAIGAHFAKMFANVPDTRFGEDTHWLSADGEHAVSEWTLTGTLPDGSRMEVRGCDLFRLREGKIVLKDSYLKQAD